MESTDRSPRLDIKQNKYVLAVRICLQMHINQNINSFPHGQKKLSLICQSGVIKMPVSEQLPNLVANLLISLENH